MDLATPKQVAFITKLLGERDLEGTAYSRWSLGLLRELGKREASEAIEHLLTLPRERSSSGRRAQSVDEGMWLVGDRIFKAQRAVHGSGNLYAKELVGTSFVYVPGALRLLAAEGRRMTLEEAKAYGALYGVCCVCGRTLTDEVSIEAGIGPVCARRF